MCCESLVQEQNEEEQSDGSNPYATCLDTYTRNSLRRGPGYQAVKALQGLPVVRRAIGLSAHIPSVVLRQAKSCTWTRCGTDAATEFVQAAALAAQAHSDACGWHTEQLRFWDDAQKPLLKGMLLDAAAIDSLAASHLQINKDFSQQFILFCSLECAALPTRHTCYAVASRRLRPRT